MYKQYNKHLIDDESDGRIYSDIDCIVTHIQQQQINIQTNMLLYYRQAAILYILYIYTQCTHFLCMLSGEKNKAKRSSFVRLL